MNNPLHVLVVEDNPSDAELIIRRLVKEGFQLDWIRVDDEQDFVEKFHDGYDLILSDWSLPDFSGLRALEITRKLDADIPFIIVSGSIGEEAAVDALHRGASDYLLKDRPERLGQAIRNALEQKTLRDQRKIQEELLRLQATALSSAANAIVITDAEGTIAWANPAFVKLTGFTTSEAIGRKPQDLIKSGKHDPNFYAEMWNTILAGNVWRGEMINRRKDGSFYNEEMTITPIIGSNGIIQQFVAIKEDVTQQKTTEKILRARLKLHELATHQTLQSLLQSTLDIAEELTDSEIGFFHFLDSDQEKISLQAWSNATHNNFCRVSEFTKHYDLLEAGVWADCIRQRKPIVHNSYANLPDRKGLPIGHATIERELVVPIFRKEQIVAIIGVGNKKSEYSEADVDILTRFADLSWDVIEKKNSDEILRESEDRFRQLAENMREVFWLRDDKTRKILYVNPAFETIWGIPSEDFYQQPQIFMNSVHPLDLERVINAQNEMRLRSIPFNEKYRILKPDGTCRWINARTYPVHDEHREVIRYAGIAEDITEQYESQLLLRKSAEELEFAYDATLEGWSNALELREHETAGHSNRVVQATLELASLMGVEESQLVHIQRGALLHDIGKMGIPDNILLKPGPLTEEEWQIMRQHPIYAHSLLSKIPYLEPALDIPYSHHERWNGSGYPQGLKGEEIPLSARIFAVVDVWDALSCDRPYRQAWKREEIIQYMQEQSGQQFDPEVVKCFLELIKQKNVLR